MTNGTDANDVEKTEFANNVYAVAAYGLTAKDYGRKFVNGKGTFFLVGIKPRSRKNPLVIKAENGTAAGSTATAGNGTYAISTSGQSVDVSGDICPLGWHLPTLKTNGGELNKLVESIGANVDVFASPANLVLSGMKYYGDSPELSSLGSTGYYWSSTSYNSSNPLANYLAVNYYQSSNPPVIFNPNVYGYYKVMSGYSVRWLAT